MAFRVTSVSYDPAKTVGHVTLSDDALGGDRADTVSLSFTVAPAAVAISSSELPEEKIKHEAKVLLQKAVDAL